MECVVFAAGEGKRMRPLTARRPKVMLPLANRPMMEHLILAARDAGITDFVLVVGYGEREVRKHFDDGSRWGIRIAAEDGWYLVRASGTEHKIRITAEGTTLPAAKVMLERGRMLVKQGKAA